MPAVVIQTRDFAVLHIHCACAANLAALVERRVMECTDVMWMNEQFARIQPYIRFTGFCFLAFTSGQYGRRAEIITKGSRIQQTFSKRNYSDHCIRTVLYTAEFKWGWSSAILIQIFSECANRMSL